MREKDIIDAINGIHVNPLVKARIMNLDKQKYKPKVQVNLGKPIVTVVVILLICSLGLGIPFLSGNKTSLLPGGFGIIAYAANGDKVALSPNVETSLGKYSPMMSSVPGFPFHIEFIRMAVQQIQVSVDNGTILIWEPTGGTVEDKGKSYIYQTGDTIYWSPLSKDSVLSKESKLTISAIKNDSEIMKAEILIKELDDSEYSAEIIYLMSKPVKVNGG